MRDAQPRAQAGLDVQAGRRTVGDFLGLWLDGTVKPAKAWKTHASYEEIVRLHLVPMIGRIRLEKLNPADVNAMLRTKEAEGLSPRRVAHIRAVLRNALNEAIRWQWILTNAAALATPPKQVAREVRPFCAEDARALLAATEGDRLAAAYRTALSLGLREGEVLGLGWDDVDLEAGRLRVRHALQRQSAGLVLKDPKSRKSRRSLDLPASVVAALLAHRDRQSFERAAAGNRWVDTGLIFTTTIGTPVDPRNLIRAWHRLLERAGLPRRPFHTTRHSAVSLMAAEGVPMKVVQEVVGHSLLATTADTYGHLFPSAFKEAADAMERALAG